MPVKLEAFAFPTAEIDNEMYRCEHAEFAYPAIRDRTALAQMDPVRDTHGDVQPLHQSYKRLVTLGDGPNLVRLRHDLLFEIDKVGLLTLTESALSDSVCFGSKTGNKAGQWYGLENIV
jgi:hypothetical protein